MSYIQITTRCNMTCDHCCYSCGPEGEDMSIRTFKNALKLDEMISIGGGEPTLHPQFWEMLGLAIGSSDYVWLATNGTVTDTALALAKLAKKQVIGCELSLDQFHDAYMVDQEVKQAFWNLVGGIRDITHDGKDNPIWQGRTKEYYTKEECRADCVCPGTLITPSGDVKPCGCEDAPILGNVNDHGFDLNDAMRNLYGEDYECNECDKNQPTRTR